MALFAPFMAGGCAASGDSCEVPTDEMSMVGLVVDNGPTVRAEVDFESGQRDGLGLPLRLCDDDELFINGDEPRESERGPGFVYSLTIEDGSVRDFEFELKRNDRDEVITLDVSLADAFDITSPVPGAQLSRMEDLVVIWEPADPGGMMRIELEEEIGGGICLTTDQEEHAYKELGGIEVDDAGMWTIPAGVVTGQAECVGRYRLSRFTDGEYPSKLGPGGHLEAQVLRLIDFTSIP